MQMTIIVFKACVFEDGTLFLGITMCWPLYRNICRIQDDRFYGDHLLKITREIFINAIPSRQGSSDSSKLSHAYSCDPRVIWRKKDATEEVAYMINFMEYNMLGKQNISLLIMQESAMLISIMI